MANNHLKVIVLKDNFKEWIYKVVKMNFILKKNQLFQTLMKKTKCLFWKIFM